MRNLPPILLTLAMLCGILFQEQAKPDAARLESYHDAVRRIVEDIPLEIGPWYGTKVKAPEAAIQLLKPNVIFSCQYRNRDTGRVATMTLVQCRDSRDMAGHFPPVCYPASGWATDAEPSTRAIRVGGADVPMARYEFSRLARSSEHGLPQAQEITVYGFFVLPGKGFATSMSDVRSAASDLRVRGLGAGQVQVLMDSGAGVVDEENVVRDLLAPVIPALRAIEDDTLGKGKGP
ncbi:MAG: exosortase-associated EpsI family protein [Phycisphaerales bacterium]|nr:exosortase-associated EpsI family protein [Phycisphaerales bacterium]